MHVLETRSTDDGVRRARVALEGREAPYGWLTAVSKDGITNLRLAVHEVCSKPTLIRSAFELNSDKVGELPPGTRVHVVETRSTADGARRACVALESQIAWAPIMRAHGWLTATTKDGSSNIRPIGANPSLDPVGLKEHLLPTPPRG